MDPGRHVLSAGEQRRWLLAAGGAAVFVAAAVGLELAGGVNSNSPVPDWAEIAPIAWPPAVRVLWWTAVAASAGVFRLALHRLGLRQRPVVVAVSVMPFLVFAAGIAVGAEWSIWH